MSLAIGDSGSAVRRLQQRLAAAGFDPGGVDGKFGRHTEAAVKAFQRSHHLKVDGVVGEDTNTEFHQFQNDRNADRFDPPMIEGPAAPGTDGTANGRVVSNAGGRRQMVQGTVTVNGHQYTFRSGGHGRGSLPEGTYNITPHMHSRNDRSMSVGGVGYSFAMSDKFDPRVNGTRRLLRIHPDGGTAGTEGCMGIVGNADVQRQFRADMEAEIRRNGGSYQLNVNY
jgi:peptidoglycan hydrolase-like protein with peptidoglycan-binding domain